MPMALQIFFGEQHPARHGARIVEGLHCAGGGGGGGGLVPHRLDDLFIAVVTSWTAMPA